MRQASPSHNDVSSDGIHILVDEIINALKRPAGIDASSTLPGKTEAAAKLGADRQQRAFPIGELALHIGSISDSVGELGARHAMKFSAHEYRVFNQCIDSITSTAVEQFSHQDHDTLEHEAIERVGFLAHELRNSLGTARMSFALLRSGQVGLGSRTADIHERALTRLEQLVEQTLLDARLRARVAQRHVSVNVENLLNEVAVAIPPERDVDVTVDAKPDLEVVTDERLLISAVSNLVQNAVKFSHDAGRVVVRAKRHENAILIEVEDECGGLPPGKTEKLFEPHVQAGANRRGFGLGLAITRQAVERIGGKIFVRNLPNKGCVFAITLENTARTS
jgi:signal transduction histidine kinase